MICWHKARDSIMQTPSDIYYKGLTEVAEMTLKRLSNYTRLPIRTAEVTNRTFEQYLDYFSLQEEFYKGKRICDLGGGLATFTEGLNNFFGKDGTKAFSVDPVYQVFPDLNITESTTGVEAYKRFEDKLFKRSTSSPGYYCDDKEVKDYLEKEKVLGEQIKNMVLRASSQYIAGSGEALPFTDKSIDLLFSVNYLFRNQKELHPGSSEGFAALSEAGRALKENGQLMIFPLHKLRAEKKDQGWKVEYAGDSGKQYVDSITGEVKDVLNRESVIAMQKLEDQGLKFYYIINKEGHHLLVGRKDDNLPQGFEDFETSCTVLKLEFSEHKLNESLNIPVIQVTP